VLIRSQLVEVAENPVSEKEIDATLNSAPQPTEKSLTGMTEAPLAKRGKRLFPPDDLLMFCCKNQFAIDPCKVLPEHILFRITSALDHASLVRLSECNLYYRTVCRRNEAGWEQLCEQEWATKVHVCDEAVDNIGSSALEAFRMARLDASERHYVRRSELCYDPVSQRGSVWSFRFKESAGAEWTTSDPWYEGREARLVVFLEDGRVRSFEELSDSDEGNEMDDSNVALLHLQNQRRRRGRLTETPVQMSWRFLTRPMDLPTREIGSYVRFNVGGRDVPTYSVRRAPTNNWGFIMESCWGLFTSFPLPKRSSRRSNQPGAGDRLLTDESLRITNDIQWREAFLYNVGARELPEGDAATEQFDRAWGGGAGATIGT